jgi:VCBS repeat protein
MRSHLLALAVWLQLVTLAGVAAAQQPNVPPSRQGFPVVLPGSGEVTAVAVGELDGDGNMDIVVATRNRQLWVLNSVGQVRPGWPQPVAGLIGSQPLIANLDGSGPKIVVSTGLTTLDPSGLGTITVFNLDGSVLWQRVSPEAGFGFFSSPAVADLDGDGRLEVIVGGFDQRLYVLRSDGSDQPGFPVRLSDSTWSSPAVADLDGDGRLEIIIGIDAHSSPPPNQSLSPCNPLTIHPTPPTTPDGGALVVLRSNGSPFPGFPVCIDETIMSSPAVGDIDGSGFPSIVVGTGTFWSSIYGDGRGRRVHAFRRDGTPVPGWPQPTGAINFSSPALADLNGDGILDVIIGSDDQAVHAFLGNGTPFWATVPKSFFGTTGAMRGSPVVATVDRFTGGGLAVLIPINTEVAVLSATGIQLTDEPPHTSGKLSLFADTTVSSNPIVTTLDGTPFLYVVFGAGTPFPGAENGKVYAYDVGRAGAMPWPQFHREGKHSGCVGAFCTATPPPPPTPSKTHTVDPCRVLDTRFASPPGPLAPFSLRSISVTGNLVNQGAAANCGVPPGAKGVYINVVAVTAQGSGHLTVFPFLSAPPLASTINFAPGDTVANGVVVPICVSALGACASDLTIQMGPAAAHVIVDVTGYLAAP